MSDADHKRVAKCWACDHEIELDDGPTPPECPRCGSTDIWEKRRTVDEQPEDEDNE